jgi:hypothetical protein
MRQDLLRHMIVVYTPPAARPAAPAVPVSDPEPVKTA